MTSSESIRPTSHKNGVDRPVEGKFIFTWFLLSNKYHGRSKQTAYPALS